MLACECECIVVFSRVKSRPTLCDDDDDDDAKRCDGIPSIIIASLALSVST